MSDTATTIQDTRKAIRDKIFTAKPESKILKVFGTTIELRQPSLATVFDANSSEDRKESVALMLVRFAYVPNTDERIFEDSDVDGIVGLPWNADLQKINEAIGALTGANVTDATKSSTPQGQSEVGDAVDGGQPELESQGTPSVDAEGT